MFLISRRAASCAVFKLRRGRRVRERARSRNISVVIARGTHLFPFRTEQLSPSAPMVLGSKGPGRVGRRRFSCRAREPPFGAARDVSGGSREAGGGARDAGGPLSTASPGCDPAGAVR